MTDEDDPTSSFATRQSVRVCKTVLLLRDPRVDDTGASSEVLLHISKSVSDCVAQVRSSLSQWVV